MESALSCHSLRSRHSRSSHLQILFCFFVILCLDQIQSAPIEFEIQDIRCNRGWNETTNKYSGKLDYTEPVASDVTFSGHEFGQDQSREFAVERCFNGNDNCARVSNWFPDCGNSCGDADLALIYDGFIKFRYGGGGVTEVKMRYTDQHVEENADAKSLTFKLIEKIKNADGTFEELKKRVGEWEIKTKMLAECRDGSPGGGSGGGASTLETSLLFRLLPVTLCFIVYQLGV